MPQIDDRLWQTLEQFESPPRAANTAFSWVDDAISRRSFLTVLGASIALAGLDACSKMPIEKIFPYVTQPESLTPGEANFYATAFLMGGYAQGILAQSQMNRPVKVEGNPSHPASLGKTNVFAQASILELYDPDRSQNVRRFGEDSTWDEFERAVEALRPAWAQSRGMGLRILTGAVTSPTQADLMRQVLAQYPEARWHRWEPVNRDNAREGSITAFGRDLLTIHHFDRARAILSLDSDFLSRGPAAVRDAHAFIDGRRVRKASKKMNRLYVAEASYTLTGAMADHRLALRPSELESLSSALARKLGVLTGTATATEAAFSAKHAKWIDGVAADLRAGDSLVVVGDEQPAWLHALGHAINERLGAAGKTLDYISPVEADPTSHLESITQLCQEMAQGQVQALFILGGNPAYDAPADLAFAENLAKVPFRARLGLSYDETSYLCQWHLPEAHALESWGDARAHDGTASIIQPLISPLYQGRSALDVVASVLGPVGTSAHDFVKSHWMKKRPELIWEKLLNDGVIPGTSEPVLKPALRAEALALPSAQAERASSPGLELVFRPDPHIWDGRYANNGWLQELGKPMSKLTWDNAVFLGPETAAGLGLKTEDEVELSFGGHSVRGAVFVLAGHPDGSVTVHLGYGRERAGRVGDQHGFNAYGLRTSKTLNTASGVEVTPTKKRRELAITHWNHQMEGRAVARHGTLAEFMADPTKIVAPKKPVETLMPPYPPSQYAWGMSIDLNACIGCNTCTIACQAENNIPVVGKEQVRAGREMHWIRVDRYFHGPVGDPKSLFQPVPCMHCETAPCEEVCPTAATNHSTEGLNQMVYNRCVGTRYCSNNCPYKVRRFNFLQYADVTTPVLQLAHNPSVTVRSRGVMEKCTYCVQRIERTRIQAEVENRPIRDGEFTTACAQACPTEAIVFGNIRDPKSRVAQLKEEPLDYAMLEDLGTLPRTTYLPRLRNPNPALEST